MEDREDESVQYMIGTMSQMNVADETAYERSQYMKVIQSFYTERAIAFFGGKGRYAVRLFALLVGGKGRYAVRLFAFLGDRKPGFFT